MNWFPPMLEKLADTFFSCNGRIGWGKGKDPVESPIQSVEYKQNKTISNNEIKVVIVEIFEKCRALGYFTTFLYNQSNDVDRIYLCMINRTIQSYELHMCSNPNASIPSHQLPYLYVYQCVIDYQEDFPICGIQIVLTHLGSFRSVNDFYSAFFKLLPRSIELCTTEEEVDKVQVNTTTTINQLPLEFEDLFLSLTLLTKLIRVCDGEHTMRDVVDISKYIFDLNRLIKNGHVEYDESIIRARHFIVSNISSNKQEESKKSQCVIVVHAIKRFLIKRESSKITIYSSSILWHAKLLFKLKYILAEFIYLLPTFQMTAMHLEHLWDS
jgi:hypothetical protein